MKTVHPSDMVTHLWANRAQAYARNSGNTLYFRGDIIYSYGEHFPIARHIEHKGNRAVLFTIDSHSRTTTGQCYSVARAIPDEFPVFHVPDLGNTWRGPDHIVNLRSYSGRIESHGKSFVNPRTTANRGAHESAVLNLNGERNAYVHFFGLRLKPTTGTIAEIVAACEAELERIAATEKRRMVATANKARKESDERLERWKAGEDVSTHGFQDTYIRVKGNIVESSWGARVPLADAVRAFPIILQCRAHASEWHRNGQTIQVGDFHFNRIDPTGDIKVGCHRIAWVEVERVARMLNLIP